MAMPQQVSSLHDIPVPRSIRALLLDDSNFDRARIRRLSNRTQLPIQLDEVGTIEELDHAVNSASYDLIMIDYRLPVGDGFTALETIQHNPLNKGAGTIMITGDGALDTAVTAMRRGCHDFLSKDAMTADQLKTAMMNAMTVATQRRDLALQAEHQREIIRQGLTAALMDERVQGTVISLFQRQMALTQPDRPRLWPDHDPRELDALLACLHDEDEFIFH